MTPARKQGCRWGNEMTLLLSISSHSCCYQQAKAGVGVGLGGYSGGRYRQTDKTDWKGRRDDESGTE